MQKYVLDAGYDMSATADKIEEFYLHKHNDHLTLHIQYAEIEEEFYAVICNSSNIQC